jgi:hypothetical protein
VRLARVALAASLLSGPLLACNGGASDCMPLEAQPLDEAAGCLRPPVSEVSVAVCHDPTLGRGVELLSACFVDAAGRVYGARVGSAEWIGPRSGVGWTHSALTGAASTLSAADAVRCAPVFAASPPSCP